MCPLCSEHHGIVGPVRMHRYCKKYPGRRFRGRVALVRWPLKFAAEAARVRICWGPRGDDVQFWESSCVGHARGTWR